MLVRPHPIWGDWLHVQAGDMQRLMDRLLNDRDKALEVDPAHSGTPLAFVQYCQPIPAGRFTGGRLKATSQTWPFASRS